MTVTKSLTLKTKTGPKSFTPGETFNVDPEKAQPYIKQGLLKPVEDLKLLDGLSQGSLIEWRSPIFGLLSGRVEIISGDELILVEHPINNDGTFGTAFIQTEWVTRIIQEGISDD